MEPRKYPHGVRTIDPRSRVGERRVLWSYIPLRVPDSWARFVRNWRSPVGRQKVMTRLRAWAYNNALTLIFLSTMFIVTWAVQLVVAVVNP